MDKVSWHTKVTVLFSILFIGFMVFTAGQSSAHHWYNQMTLNLLLGAFFAAIVGAIVADKYGEVGSRIEAARRDEKQKASRVMGEMIEAMRAATEEARKADMINAIIKDVTKGKKAQKVHVAKIVKAIHDNLELFAEVSINAEGGFDVAFQDTPLEVPPKPKRAAPGRSAAHDAAAKRGDAARAKIAKPLTKSQERRIAATKKASK